MVRQIRVKVGGDARYPCVQTSAQGKCFYDNVSYITGASGKPYLNQNIWNANAGYQQTLYSASPKDWYIIANANTHFGGVLTYPNVGWDMSGSIDSKAVTTSSWNVTIPHNAESALWAAYDLWFNNWADEVMIQVDIQAPIFYDTDYVTSATFGGVPWHMSQFGAERVWKAGPDDAHKILQPSGSLDIKEILVWMEQNGQLPANSQWTAGSFGFEVCDTGGIPQKLSVTDFTWTS